LRRQRIAEAEPDWVLVFAANVCEIFRSGDSSFVALLQVCGATVAWRF